jgi:hypothetical protein
VLVNIVKRTTLEGERAREFDGKLGMGIFDVGCRVPQPIFI